MGSESLKLADSCNTVASYYFKTRRYERALYESQHCLSIRKKVFGDYTSIPPHPRVADSYSNVGLILRLLGKEETFYSYDNHLCLHTGCKLFLQAS